MRVEHDTILSLELPYRERLTLSRTAFTGGNGPRVAVVSGIHGDELEGLYVAHRLGAWLEDLGRQWPEALRGRVELYPAVNPLGLDTLERTVPPQGVDLNRTFPGDPRGLIAQRLAGTLMRELTGAALVVDVHAAPAVDATTRVMLRMTAPLRDAFDIPYHDVGPPDAAAHVALVAGIHGNELNGVFVLARLAAYLRGVAAGAYAGQELRQRAFIVPAVNVLGLNTQSRAWPFDRTDINRMFPGYDAGETTQRIAHVVLELTRRARYRVDIHASNLDFEELPQVRLYDPSPAERQTAMRFGLPAVVERPMDTVFTTTIGHAWRQSPGESFVLQAGRAGSLQPAHCERLFRALVAFLGRTGVLAGVELAADEEPSHYFGLHQTCPLIAERAGMFVSTAEVGRWLQAGAVIGQVFDGFDGELREELRAPVAGLLSGIRRQPLLYQGNLIARIQTRLDLARGKAMLPGGGACQAEAGGQP